MNLFTALRAAWPSLAHRPAILTDTGPHYTWRDIDRATAMMARVLDALAVEDRTGLPPIVAAHVDKSVEALLLYLATLRAGWAFLPLNPAYRADELGYFLQDAQPAVLVHRPEDEDWVAPLAQRTEVPCRYTMDDQRGGTWLAAAASQPDDHEPALRDRDDVAAILYTSGTTGRSKGAMLSHGNLLSNARTLLRHWDWREDDCLVHALPIFHIHGLFVAGHCALLSGTPMRWLRRFDPHAVAAQIADRHAPRATVFMGVPTMYGRLLQEASFTRELAGPMRLFISGSAPLTATAFEAFAERTGHVILERYGMSETGMLCSNPCRADEGPREPGSVGRPLPGVGLRIVDEQGATLPAGGIGEVQVKGPNVFHGYLRMPQKTAESFTQDGWFRTGDIGHVDEQGYVRLVGRAKDLIISGGFNVYPAEVEDHIERLPGISECAVVGVPHPDFGEGVIAVIVVAGQDGTIEEDAVIAALKQKIAGYKVPKRVFCAPDLPRNAMGKVQKNVLRERYATVFQ